MTKDSKNIDDVLRQALPSALTEEMEAARQRIFATLRSDDGAPVSHPLGGFHFTASPGWRRAAVWGAVAALLAAAVWTGAVFQQNRSIYAVLRTPDGTAYRGAAQQGGAIRIGERIHAGETVRTNESGGIIELADGSIVEMRQRSELRLERAQDGVRIRLNEGSVIVNAAKQRQGHLYVQTKDITVSVVGTVFLVNAEEEGSRVAVIQGEVRVLEGTTQKELRPGEQVITKPVMKWQPVSEEISWSKSRETHLALLQQSTPATSTSPATGTPKAFEVVSVRPSGVAAGGGERGGGGGRRRNPRPAGEPCGSPSEPTVDPGLFDASEATVTALILWAYGFDCEIWRGSDLLFGGPQWIKDDGFDIQAVIPKNSPSYTADLLRAHKAPQLQEMLQTMLADRFKLVLHREWKDVPVYLMRVAKGGVRLTSPDPVTRESVSAAPGASGYGEKPRVGLREWKDGNSLCCPGFTPTNMGARKQTMADLAGTLTWYMGRPVLDRTGLGGEFNYYLRFAWTQIPGVPGRPPSPGGSPPPPMVESQDTRSIFTALEEDFGLRLESAKEQVEVLVIDRVAKPSAN